MDKEILVKGETPLYKMNTQVGETKIYMKRDDLIEFACGGNKVRLYEYMLPEIQRSNCQKIITFGSSYSNHVRVSAAVAARLHLDCDIIILNEGQNWEGNMTLSVLWGANVVLCNENNAHDFIDDYLEQQVEKGIKYYFVPGGYTQSMQHMLIVKFLMKSYLKCKKKGRCQMQFSCPVGQEQHKQE